MCSAITQRSLSVADSVVVCSSAYDRGRMSPYRADHRGHSNASNGYSSGGMIHHFSYPSIYIVLIILNALLSLDMLGQV